MKREIVMTKDGSHSISIPQMNVTYHSVHGAIQESKHVFIEAGLHYVLKQSTHPYTLNILEVGFGTGLNALLTCMEAGHFNMIIHYSALEPFPLNEEEYNALNYEKLLKPSFSELFIKLHACDWEKETSLTPNFTLQKINQSLLNFSTDRFYDVVYFDAFAPAAQPELWTKNVFEKLFHMMHGNRILVTYCSKGDVRRAMLHAGFGVEKIAGPPGKREMIRAIKENSDELYAD